MTRAQVAAYLAHADRVARHVYMQERWVRPPSLSDTIIGGWDEYDIPARWQRRYLREIEFSDVFFEAGFDTGRR